MVELLGHHGSSRWRLRYRSLDKGVVLHNLSERAVRNILPDLRKELHLLLLMLPGFVDQVSVVVGHVGRLEGCGQVL